MGVFTILIQE